MKNINYAAAVVIVFFGCLSVEAKITKIEITRTEAYRNGQSFGDIGPYDRLYGRAYGEVDPCDASNKIIQDIALAPKNAKGNVEYVADIILTRPRNLSKSDGILYMSVPNRGNPGGIDDYFLTRGYIVLTAAWQGDVLAGGNRLTLKVPVATDNGKEITGRHRAEYQVNRTTITLPLGFGVFNGNSHQSYETVSLDNSTAVLTKRVLESDPKTSVPNSDWAFSDCSSTAFPGTPSTTQISLKGGFEPGYIYELIYTAKNPLVLGLGLAATRDINSFFKYAMKDEQGNPNPLLTSDNKIPVKAAIIQGVSQSGLYIRSFLQLGFNKDENGKKVFDGANPHIGPRRVSLNVRFARPGGGAGQRTDHLFPSFEPPFSLDVTYDPVSGITGGILERCLQTNTCPKVFQTFSSTEYWQLRASQRTTDSLGKEDLKFSDNVRTYFFAGTQHTPGGGNSIDRVSGFMQNPNSYQPNLKALLVALEQWVLDGVEPPKSAYPKIADGTLVKPDKASIGWPDIPGVPYTGMVNKGALIDFGPDFNIKDVTGILREPPVEFKGKDYTILVPKVDKDGNEIGGLRNVTMQVPLGTYTGWALCAEGYGKGDLNGLNGMFIPFKKTKQERLDAGDPRLSLEERYGTQQGYIDAVIKAANELVKQRYLLQDDADRIIERAKNNPIM
jgi:hypothetical protein